MKCTHTDRPNVIGLNGPLAWHCCRECWDAKIQPKLDALPMERVDYSADYQRFGRDLYYRTSAGWRCENPSKPERRWK